MKKEKQLTWGLYGVVWFFIAAFYFWLGRTAADQPAFLLRPVVGLTSFLSGFPFRYLPGVGYITAVTGMTYTLERSCSGGIFLVICYSLLMAVQVPRVRGTLPKCLAAAGALVLSYLCAVLASSLRIVSTFVMMDSGLRFDWVTLHNLIGIITYFCFICICYWAASRLFSACQVKGATE